MLRSFQRRVRPDFCLLAVSDCSEPHRVAQMGFTPFPDCGSSASRHIAPDLEGALSLLYDSSHENFAFAPDVGLLRATMGLHRIPCESLSVDDCQLAIAHHILSGSCAPPVPSLGLPSSACRRVAGSVVDCEILARQLLRTLCQPHISVRLSTLLGSYRLASFVKVLAT
jgi:hypothetical protein